MGYIPRKDAELVNWSRNFAARIGEDPARFGLGTREAEQIQALVRNFAEAYALAVAPASRTAAAVKVKEAAGKAMLKELRPCAMLIKRRSSVANADKVNLGLNIARPSTARLPAPTSRPILSVQSGAPLCHVLRFIDSGSSESRGRPRGVAGAQLFCYLGEKVQPTVEDGQLAALCNRFLYRHQFPFSAAGQRAHYWARWHTRRGLCGPWSQRVSLVVAG